MSQNTQNPYFYTLNGDLSEVLEISGATSISVFAESDACQILNYDTGQFLNIPLGTTLELNPDSGNTLASIGVAPMSGFAYVVMLGGVAQLI